MPIDRIRRANLEALIQGLAFIKVNDLSPIAVAFDGHVTARRLASIIAGGAIPQLTCEAIEFRLGKPRRWLDADRRAELRQLVREVFEESSSTLNRVAIPADDPLESG